MEPNQINPIHHPVAGPLAAFLQDPVINLRRRMTAILATVYDEINQNRNQNESTAHLADWFFAFRSAILRNEDITGVVNEHIPHLQTLLDNPNFRLNPTVQFILNTFIPRMRTLLGVRILPNLPAPPPAAPPNNADEALRQIRARVLGNQVRRVEQEAQIGRQLDLRLNAELEQGFNSVELEMQRIFQANMERLNRTAHDDQARLQRANQAIDLLENVIADAEAILPTLENRVSAANRALDHLERAIKEANREVAQLNEAIDRKNESAGNSVLTTVLCISACIMIRIAMPQMNAVPIPGGFLLGPQIVF